MKYTANLVSNTFFVMAFAMLFAACSVKTVYNQLDYLIPAYVEGMVSLDDLLEEKVEQRTLVLINWHRNTQLNQYAEWLRALQRDINGDLTEEKLQQHIAKLDSFWLSIQERLNEEMALLLPLLNKAQLKELFESMADKNEEFREEYVDVDKDTRIAQYTERMLDSYETWFGDLNDVQEKAIEETAARLQTTAGLRLERRQQWQQSIKRILDKSDSAAQKSVALRNYFSQFSRQNTVEMQSAFNMNKTIITGITMKMVRSMSPDQKAHFVTTTNDYIRMFKDLANE